MPAVAAARSDAVCAVPDVLAPLSPSIKLTAAVECKDADTGQACKAAHVCNAAQWWIKVTHYEETAEGVLIHFD